MFIKGKCKKCEGTAIFNIEDMSREEVGERLKEFDFGECKAGGWHVELYSLYDGFILDWDSVSRTKEKLLESIEKDIV